MSAKALSEITKNFLNHPAGPKTIHFWAPAWKWMIVIAGISDIKRPAADVSVPQSIALTATGLIWARYSTQIIPFNVNLLAVNLFVAAIGSFQISKVITYHYFTDPDPSPSTSIEDLIESADE